MKGRVAILKVHTKGKPLDKAVDVEGVARQSPGFSGADLANLVNEAAILSARRNKKVIGMSEFQEALERIVAGPERKSRIISDAEKAIIAYHEGGHAVVQRILPKCDPVAEGHDHQPRHGPRLHDGPADRGPLPPVARPSSRTRSPGCSAATSPSGSSSATRRPAPATTSRRRPTWPAGWSPSSG